MSGSTPVPAASLRLAFLVGHDTRETRAPLEAVCAIPGVTLCAILLDTERISFRQRLKKLRQNIRRNGLRYIPYSAFRAVRTYTDRMVERAVLRPGEVTDLLRRSFPERHFTLSEIGNRYGVLVQEVGNLNSPAAIAALRASGADLGVVLGARILKPGTFAVPKLGSINLHKGKVPDYRGIPPGIWELYDGESVAGVTVHFVDSKVDTGDVVETGEIDLSPLETPESLAEKLHQVGIRVLVKAVTAILAGTAVRKRQTDTKGTARTIPTLSEMATLRRRLPHWKRPAPLRAVAEDLLYLLFFHCGIYSYLHRTREASHAAVILYRSLNDYSSNMPTVNTETFAAQLLAISKYYPVMTSGELARRIRDGEAVPPKTVAVHFDDDNRESHREALAVLRALGIPAPTVMGPENGDRERAAEPGPADCCREAIRDWMRAPLEIRAHTVNSADVSKYATEADWTWTTGTHPEETTGRHVLLFLYSSAMPRSRMSGEFVEKQEYIGDIQRLVVSSAHKPLWMLMEIEECSWRWLAASLKRRLPARAA